MNNDIKELILEIEKIDELLKETKPLAPHFVNFEEWRQNRRTLITEIIKRYDVRQEDDGCIIKNSCVDRAKIDKVRIVLFESTAILRPSCRSYFTDLFSVKDLCRTWKSTKTYYIFV